MFEHVWCSIHILVLEETFPSEGAKPLLRARLLKIPVSHSVWHMSKMIELLPALDRSQALFVLFDSLGFPRVSF